MINFDKISLMQQVYIYLIQHAEAKPESEDPKRGLSEKGLNDIRKVASYLARINIHAEEIFHSGKLRAKETAEVVADALKIKISQTDGLSPLDDPEIWAERLRETDRSLILVGHLPHLGRLASLLLCGDREKNVVSFRNAGVVCLVRVNDGWTINWIILPEILPD